MKITIVNTIQPSLSGEENHDTEPNIAVNPVNVRQIAATAFSPDPLGGAQGPVYRSVDEGTSWDEPDFFPTQTLDQTLRFAGSSKRLYASYIDPSYNTHIVVKADLTVNGLASDIKTKPGTAFAYFDQPYIQAYSVMGGSGVNADRVYVGGNDHGLSRVPAAIIQSIDAGISAPAFNEYQIESRIVSRDGPQVRIAAHPDGTVYAVFYSWTGGSITSDVVIVRDDNWGNVTTPYQDLKDSDTHAGKRIATGVQFTWAYLVGNQRTAGDLSIAVDPRDSGTVYVAYAEMLGGVYTIHLVRSLNHGAGWSGDLLPVTNATHPCLAINSHGKIGYLYQQVTGFGSSQRWATHFRSSDNGTTWDDVVLCSAFLSSPGNPPNGIFGLGDYAHIMAAGRNFYGVFPADNTPDLANFPATATVIYNRVHNFVTRQLLANDGVTSVLSSVDPFFFKIEELAPENDFYVRDWTNSLSDHDSGQEPSTYPWFYIRSDVWNRNTNTPGTFVNDQPQTDPVNAGTGSGGDNFVFARISRNNASTATTVNAEFLFANFGLGVPYASLGAPVPVAFAVGDLQHVTSLPWHLDPTASDHCCLAVQISSPNDPFIPPGLLGYSPGWPTGDMMVINDNNKAQRNLNVSHVMAGMTSQQFIRVRNAAFTTRDLKIKIDITPSMGVSIPRSRIEVIGGESDANAGEIVTLKRMKPGENRWVSVALTGFEAKEGTELPINFIEMKGNQAANGCAIVLRSSSAEDVIRAIARAHTSLLHRITHGLQLGVDGRATRANSLLLKGGAPKDTYVRRAPEVHLALRKMHDVMRRKYRREMRIDLTKEFRLMGRKFAPSHLTEVLSAHSSALEKLDAQLTMLLLERGDLACILSNVLWQRELYSNIPSLRRLKPTSDMLDAAERFVEAYPRRRVTDNDYPELIMASMRCFKETAKSIRRKRLGLNESISRLNENMNSLRGLQDAHYEFLSKLNNYFKL